ncbi:MAG TPA: hypothetical protein VIL79_06980 [Thermoleophilia bacterium]
MEETPGATVPSGEIDRRWLEELCRRTDDVLWNSYRFALGVTGAPWPRVMFPLKGREWRVGEQEARLAFAAAVLADVGEERWALAAEVPTRFSYRSAQRNGGAKAQRALTDLALFRQARGAPALAVQFKSGGRSGKAEIDENIRHDIAVILAEQPDALWFHVVRDVNGASLQGLLRTLDAAISRLSNPFKLRDYLAPGKTVELRAKTIAVHVCALNPDVTASIHRVLDYVPGKPERDFFTLATTAARASLEIADGQGWSVYRGRPLGSA